MYLCHTCYPLRNTDLTSPAASVSDLSSLYSEPVRDVSLFDDIEASQNDYQDVNVHGRGQSGSPSPPEYRRILMDGIFPAPRFDRDIPRSRLFVPMTQLPLNQPPPDTSLPRSVSERPTSVEPTPNRTLPSTHVPDRQRSSQRPQSSVAGSQPPSTPSQNDQTQSTSVGHQEAENEPKSVAPGTGDGVDNTQSEANSLVRKQTCYICTAERNL